MKSYLHLPSDIFFCQLNESKLIKLVSLNEKETKLTFELNSKIIFKNFETVEDWDIQVQAYNVFKNNFKNIDSQKFYKTFVNQYF